MKKVLSILGVFAFFFATAVAATHSKHAATAIEASVSFAAIAGIGGVSPRKLFDDLRQKYGENRVVTPAELRAEVVMVNGQADYLFSFYKVPGESVTEKKLKFQDKFLAYKLGLFLMAEPIAVPGIGKLETYPNPIVFPDESGQLQNAHLEVIYNGHFSFKVGDTTYIDDFPTRDCREVNTAQKASGVANSERHPHNGFIDLIGNITLIGSENQDLRLTIPANNAQKVQSTAGAYLVKLVCILNGFKVTGAGK